jgi:hypothetical protein
VELSGVAPTASIRAFDCGNVVCSDTFEATRLTSSRRSVNYRALSTRSTVVMAFFASFITRYALHTTESPAARAANGLGVRAPGVGASCSRTVAARRKQLAPRAPFVAVGLDRN